MTTITNDIDVTADARARPGLWVFSTLFFIEAMTRASLATVIPLQTYDLLKEPRYVSYLGFAMATGGLLIGLGVPLLIARISRRWTYTLGAACLIAGAVAFTAHSLPGQIAGIAIRNFGALCLNIALMLYIMDFVRKHELVRNDSRRMAVATVGWTIGPYLGVWLYERIGPFAAFGWSAGWAAILIAVFWYFRLSDTATIIPAKAPPANPLHFIPRFLAQPRLILAWMIAFGRSGYWSMLFTYGAILMTRSGQGAEAAGILISLSQVLLISALLWGRVGGWIGLRPTIALCFAGMAVSLVVAGLVGEHAPLVAGAIFLVTSFFAVGLDAVGGVPFYRAVRARERAPMTAVYRTYLEIGDLLPNLVFGVVLLWLPLGSVFVAYGLACAVYGWICWRWLPKGM
jgi:predicted MFS family arabinose efflux permease